MSDFCPVKMVDGRCKDLDSTSYSYKLQDGRFALDAVIPADLDIDEARMSVWVPFADGKRRDGVGDLLEVGGIVCERHRTNPISLFDHGKEVTLPIGLCEDPETKAYTVQIDPVEQVARANVFFYQDGHKDRDHGLFCDQLYDLLVKRYVRAGSIGYQVIDAVEIPPDYTKGIPQGMHLKKVLMLEASVVVLPANADTTRKALSLSRVAGKPMSPVLYKSLSSHIGEVKAQVTSGYEQKSCSGDDDLCETIRQILDSLSEEEESGIDVWVNKDTPHIVIIDVMDWGDPKVGEKIGNAAKKIVGDEHIIFHNEGAKPQGSSWERIRGTKTLDGRYEQKADNSRQHSMDKENQDYVNHEMRDRGQIPQGQPSPPPHPESGFEELPDTEVKATPQEKERFDASNADKVNLIRSGQLPKSPSTSYLPPSEAGGDPTDPGPLPRNIEKDKSLRMKYRRKMAMPTPEEVIRRINEDIIPWAIRVLQDTHVPAEDKEEILSQGLHYFLSEIDYRPNSTITDHQGFGPYHRISNTAAEYLSNESARLMMAGQDEQIPGLVEEWLREALIGQDGRSLPGVADHDNYLREITRNRPESPNYHRLWGQDEELGRQDVEPEFDDEKTLRLRYRNKSLLKRTYGLGFVATTGEKSLRMKWRGKGVTGQVQPMNDGADAVFYDSDKNTRESWHYDTEEEAAKRVDMVLDNESVPPDTPKSLRTKYRKKSADSDFDEEILFNLMEYATESSRPSPGANQIVELFIENVGGNQSGMIRDFIQDYLHRLGWEPSKIMEFTDTATPVLVNAMQEIYDNLAANPSDADNGYYGTFDIAIQQTLGDLINDYLEVKQKFPKSSHTPTLRELQSPESSEVPPEDFSPLPRNADGKTLRIKYRKKLTPFGNIYGEKTGSDVMESAGQSELHDPGGMAPSPPKPPRRRLSSSVLINALEESGVESDTARSASHTILQDMGGRQVSSRAIVDALGGAGIERSYAEAAIAWIRDYADDKNTTENRDARSEPYTRAGGQVPTTVAPDSGVLEEEAGGPVSEASDRGREGGDQPDGSESDEGVFGGSSGRRERVPVTSDEAIDRIRRWGSRFWQENDYTTADLLEQLEEHVQAVGVEATLAALNDEMSGDRNSDVQFYGVIEDFNWDDEYPYAWVMTYLIRSGIIVLPDTDPIVDPDLPIVSVFADDDTPWQVGGREYDPEKGDYRPSGPRHSNKLEEAKLIPGLETSEDLDVVIGERVTHMTPKVMESLDSRYGKGTWIIKSYDPDQAAMGYGVYFPDRIIELMKNSRESIRKHEKTLTGKGLGVVRNDDGNVVGVKLADGKEVLFGSDEYTEWKEKAVRPKSSTAKLLDKLELAVSYQNGVPLPDEGRMFMAQPARPVIGVTGEMRRKGVIYKGLKEGRVHVVTRDGKAFVVPYATTTKDNYTPVVFEDEDTRDMARAAQEYVDGLPPEDREGQFYGVDLVKTPDGYKPVEGNAATDLSYPGQVGYDPFVIDALVSFLTGRGDPTHVRFVRRVLTRPGKKSPKMSKEKSLRIKYRKVMAPDNANTLLRKILPDLSAALADGNKEVFEDILADFFIQVQETDYSGDFSRTRNDNELSNPVDLTIYYSDLFFGDNRWRALWDSGNDAKPYLDRDQVLGEAERELQNVLLPKPSDSGTVSSLMGDIDRHHARQEAARGTGKPMDPKTNLISRRTQRRTPLNTSSQKPSGSDSMEGEEKDLGDVRRKYRPTNSLRRRGKRSQAGWSIVHVHPNDTHKIREEADKMKIKVSWRGSKNGLDKLRLEGDSGLIDDIAVRFGVQNR